MTVGLLLGACLIGVGLLTTSLPAFGEHRMISIGNRRLSMDCSGERGAATVVLIAGGGRMAKDWAKVQPPVANFARVCSYDRAGFGESDKTTSKLQPVDEVVDDLHRLLNASGEKEPFILVAHSIAGIYARVYATRFPHELAGLVFVDSSHEEQALRLRDIDPIGPVLDELTMRKLGFFVKPGERLEWRTELPLIVLGHGKPYPRKARDGSDSQTNRMTEEQWAAWDRTWRELQEDLAKRSTHGEFRLASQSGHFIQLDQPELIIQAISDMCQERSVMQREKDVLLSLTTGR